MLILPCQKCQGEGRIYKSKYGGNDPDVWDSGQCEACEGGGSQQCENHGCPEQAAAFNDDGEALCQDCLMSWTLNYADEEKL
jgi:hypothetical protein